LRVGKVSTLFGRRTVGDNLPRPGGGFKYDF
jgi:hypothetical protein